MRAPPDVRWQPSLKPWRGMPVPICLMVLVFSTGAAHSGEASKSAAPATKPAAVKRVTAQPQRSSPPAPAQDDSPAVVAESLEADASGERFASQELRPVITGDVWQDMLLRFDQWLSVQTLYDDQQVKQMRAKFLTAAKGTAASNRQQFIKDTEAKLDILYSPSTSELQRHFAEHMSAAAPAYLKKSRRQLPDVVSLNPQQLKDRLWRFGQRYEANVDVHQTFEQMRHMHIAAQERSDARRLEQPRPAASHVASSPAGGNRSSRNGYTQARDYFPQNNSSISYTVIPAMPIFTNSGYAMFGGGVAITITRNR